MAKYQIIFIDINMKDLDGLKIAELSRTYNKDNFIVFVTAYAEFSMEGFKTAAFRYIIKDNLDKLLMECMEGILKELKFQLKTITVKFIDKERTFSVDKIFFLESCGHKLIFHILEGELKDYI